MSETKTKKIESAPDDAWVRTCQECFHQQVMKNPKEYKDDRWRGLKCKRCGSESLDYGSENASYDYTEEDEG